MPLSLLPVPRPGALDVAGFLDAFAQEMRYTVAKDEHTASDFDIYRAFAYAVRDRLVDRWFATQDRYYRTDYKRVYYLSLEFLLGRVLLNNLLNLGASDAADVALRTLGSSLEEAAEQEWESGLGNGGLGRLAACFLDSAATLGLPFYGYGIRYEFGIFRQRIKDGAQVEHPDNWLRYGNPWEIPRPDAVFPVGFYGRAHHFRDDDGNWRADWVDTQDVWAMAYDTPILGYRNDCVNTLRLWSAKSSREFDLAHFNAGEYSRAVADKTASEVISKVLYPPDDQSAGKELRLKQQYFFVAATLEDVLRRFRKRSEHRLEDLPDKVQIQLNDTHPTLVVPELMRVLVDRERVPWDQAWDLTRAVCAYTNHTVMPEALERWSGELLRSLLPRHFEIITEIDRRLRLAVRARPRADVREEKVAIVVDDMVRMANLAIEGTHAINGVARLHSDILRTQTFADFATLYPERFTNKTNGITPRRFLLHANPALAGLITEAIGDGWARDLDRLVELEPHAEDAAFVEAFATVKHRNKRALAAWARVRHGMDLDPEFLFDVQVKRIHEYKRQLLAALHAVALYHRIRDGEETVPRVVVFAGKAAPGYAMAKLVIRLIHAIGELIADDPIVSRRLRVAFLPNYSVTLAERVFPATELSEQISTAGHEASGTGNMKAALNGALTIGTLDGANIEIREAVGEENIFIFGHTAEQVATLRRTGYDPGDAVAADPLLARVLATVGALEPALFGPIVTQLWERDPYLCCADFAAYVAAQRAAEAAYRNAGQWNRMAIANVAAMGRFSSDRTVAEYAREIWKVELP